jgi:acetyltransferase-like isoleucine patch superfamily enzyme
MEFSKAQMRILGDVGNFHIGEGCKITRDPWPFFDVKAGLEFGKNVTISSGVHIFTHEHQFEKPNWRDLDEVIPEHPTIISDNVFIGVNAIITASCKYVGVNSVVGAGAVVTKDIPDNEIWAGNPAKKIRSVGGQNG